MSKLGKDRVIWESELDKQLENYKNDFKMQIKRMNNFFKTNIIKNLDTTDFTINNQSIGLNGSHTAYYSEQINETDDFKTINFIGKLIAQSTSSSYTKNLVANTTYKATFTDKTNTINFKSEHVFNSFIQLLNTSNANLSYEPCIVKCKNNVIEINFTPNVAINGVYQILINFNNHMIDIA